MKIYLIKASAGSDYSKYKAETGGPPQNIFAAAAATPESVAIEMTDETIGMKTNFSSDAELIVIFMSTPDAYRAYEIALRFSNMGRTVVLGGLHTTFNQVEAACHADALLISEVENYWEELLTDFQNGQLQKRYESNDPVNLALLKPYPTDIIPVANYNYTWSVVISRGCPYRCEFCLVHEFFDEFQLRPIKQVVDELWHLKEIGVEWVELHSDNLTHNKEYALELFAAIAPTGLKFYGETTILIARDEDLLQAAKKAGLKAVLVGIETPSAEALKAQKKNFVKPEKIKEYVSKIQSYGIEVHGDFLFGFDEHDAGIFEETDKFVNKINLDKISPHMLIPFPGSETYRKLDASGRILSKDWSEYDGTHVVHKPRKLTPEELGDGVYWFWNKNSGLFQKLRSWFTG